MERRNLQVARSFIKLEWAKPLGDPKCPYVRRWLLDCYFFSVRIHHWISSDDLRYPHDHPWWYLTIVLWGSYEDISPEGNRTLRAPAIAYFPATHKHSVKVGPKGAITFLLTGPERRTWGYWVNGKFRKRNKYFFEWGHHKPPCD